MSAATVKPKLFLREGCPFCTKVVIYMAEAKQLDAVELVVITPADVSRLKGKAGKKLTFPVQEDPNGELTFESDALIEMYVKRSGLAIEDAIAYNHFMNVFKAYGKALNTLEDKAEFFEIAGKARREFKEMDVPEADASGPGLKSEGMARPKLYIKQGCPFCARALIFLAEARLLDLVSIEPDSEENRAYLGKTSGKAPTFPCLECEVGVVKYETSDIIEMCINQHYVDREALFVEPYYTNGFMVTFTTIIKTLGYPKFVEALNA